MGLIARSLLTMRAPSGCASGSIRLVCFCAGGIKDFNTYESFSPAQVDIHYPNWRASWLEWLEPKVRP